MNDWYTQFDTEIIKRITWLINNHTDDFMCERYCEELIQYGTDYHQPLPLGFAKLTLARSYHDRQEFRNAIKEAYDALLYLQHGNEVSLLLDCYLLLGDTYVECYAHEVAIDYFLKGLELCQKEGLSESAPVFHERIGIMYMTLGDLTNGKHSLQQALQNNQCPRLMAELAICALLLKEEDCVKLTIEKIKDPNACFETTLLFDLASLLKIIDTDQYNHANLQSYINEKIIPGISACFFTVTMIYLIRQYKQQIVQTFQPEMLAVLSYPLPYYLRIRLLQILSNHATDLQSETTQLILKNFIEAYELQQDIEKQTKLSAIEELISRNQRQNEIEQWIAMANRDDLTGIYNRRYFEQLYDTFQKQSMQEQTGFALGMIDVDHFKQYNDQYGHLKGDECLKQIAGLMMENSDTFFQFARFGGDEFIFVTTNLSKEEIDTRIQTFLRQLSTLPFEDMNTQLPAKVTLSIGVTYHPTMQSYQPLPVLIEEADALLYQMKKDKNGQYLIQTAQTR